MTERVSWHRTKIVCTLGPATDRPGVLERMLRAGMDVARVNTAHGEPPEHAQRIRDVRELAQRLGQPVAILIDLPGPKFRVGQLPEAERVLRVGAEVTLGEGISAIPLTHPELIRELKPGATVSLADGAVTLRVTSVGKGQASCRVVTGGVIRSGAGVNLPDSDLSISLPTPDDEEWIVFAAQQRAEWLGVSFVRNAEDVRRVRAHLTEAHRPAIIAKIEKRQALAELDSIIEAADGVMVARGDLGVETELAEVPLAQKRIVAAANAAARPVIVATQMLESMVDNPNPTRAEVTDVANAVLDGADAVMLSAETAIGAFPVEAVDTLHRVLTATEAEFPYGRTRRRTGAAAGNGVADAISQTAYQLSLDLHAKALIVPAHQLLAVVRIARFRPSAPLMVLAESELLYRQLSLVWGVVPVRASKLSDLASCVSLAAQLLREQQLAGSGDLAIIVRASTPDASASDTLQVVTL